MRISLCSEFVAVVGIKSLSFVEVYGSTTTSSLTRPFLSLVRVVWLRRERIQVQLAAQNKPFSLGTNNSLKSLIFPARILCASLSAFVQPALLGAWEVILCEAPYD